MNRKLKGLLLISPIIAMYTYAFIQYPEMLYVVASFVGVALIFCAGLMGAIMLLSPEKINNEDNKTKEVK